MINNFISKLNCFKHDFIYELVALQAPKLCLDIGAASGYATKKIKALTPDSTRVVAFEPFAGNHKYFYQSTQSFKNVELIKKAVSQSKGVAEFCVSSVVTGEEKGWEHMPGYSSVGYLRRNQKGKYMEEFSVETISIDDLFSTHIDFMKIDVQGGELDVLLGSRSVMEKYGIDVIYIEYSGSKEILSFLNSQGYIVFDTDYMIVPKDTANNEQGYLESLGFYEFQKVNLSTGRSSYRAKFNIPDIEYSSFLREFQRNYGYIQTDIICVHKTYLQQFVCNLANYCNLVERNDESLFPPNEATSRPEQVNGSVEPLESSIQHLQESPKPSRLSELLPSGGLLERTIHYPSKWPIFTAVSAIVLNSTVPMVDPPLQWLFAAGGTALLLLLIKRTASKSNTALSELRQIKTDQQQALLRLRKRVKRLAKHQQIRRGR